MRKATFVVVITVVAAAFAAAQVYTSGTGITGIDILGAHNNGGRGCAGCHATHSGAAGGGGNPLKTGYSTDTQSGANALFGQDVSPLFGQSLTFGQDGNGGAGYVEILPGQAAAYSTNTDELRGIMMCLACHDGAIAKGQMMQGVSWEQARDLLPPGVYGPTGIPTLLGNDSGDGNTSKYGNDHPVGTAATLGALRLVSANGGKPTDPLTVTITNGAITNIVATTGSSYASFAANYGYPAIAGSAWEWGFHLPDGSTDASKAFMTCTTCHNQHVMYVYQAPRGKQIGSAIANGTYPTYFFVNAPYNPGSGNTDPKLAASTTQFCRQCHTGEQNEAMGITNVQTAF
ncbi:MAG TPA: hypothetical protein VMI10_26350 [Terriglobales bacterium]|nr:hypothetical protein [Terriglobales bacterium]